MSAQQGDFGGGWYVDISEMSMCVGEIILSLEGVGIFGEVYQAGGE